jgi:hypothetical protein
MGCHARGVSRQISGTAKQLILLVAVKSMTFGVACTPRQPVRRARDTRGHDLQVLRAGWREALIAREAILGCALVSGCASYYATVVNVDSASVSAAGAAGQSGGQASLTEGSAFEVKSGSVQGAIIIERASLGAGKEALFNAAQRRVSKLGPYDIGAAEYAYSYNPKSQKLSELGTRTR